MADDHGKLSQGLVVTRFRSLLTVTKILDPFQELPQLLDPHLPRWIPALSDAFLEHLQSGRVDRHKADNSGLLVSMEYAICRILYTFCKIRGEKVIVRFLNVETKYLELLLNAIEAAEQRDGEADGSQKWQWEQRYVVLLWLSHLLLAPFDLSTISSADFDEDASLQEVPGFKLSPDLPGIARRVIPLAVKYLGSPGKERDGAKALLVRIAMRRDMQQLGVLDSLVSWATVSLRPRPDNEIGSSHFYLGILSFIAGLLRSSSDTSDLDSYLPSIFHAVHSISVDGTEVSKAIISFALVRKMILKIIRSVVVSVLRKNAHDPASTELTETAIGYLLECVSDNDTPVRFAASKSLSIITLKLEPEMASQVVDAVLESLNRNVLWKKASYSSSSKLTRDLSAVDNQEWHGLMLTLSHLLYRRSPPPEQLSDIIHALLLGLSFEQRSTSGASVGSNVRDAACFGIWALARRYTTQELRAVPTTSVFAAKAHPETDSILQVLGTELVTTASLDPAGNIRRGASAALQELIGRHPDTVENGIWVVQAVDYHAVARRSRAMEEVALNATKLSNQYGQALLDGILGWRGVGDVDVTSRRVAGATFGTIAAELAKAVPNCYVSMIGTFLQHVNDCLRILQSRQVEERHGLLLCLSSLVDNFPDVAQLVRSSEHNVTELTQRILSSVSAILRDLQNSTYRRPELISEAASKLVISLVPVLQVAALGNNGPRELCSMQSFLTPDNQEGYSSLTSALDSNRIQNDDVDALLRALGHIVPSWLSRHEEDTVDSAAAAALVLLLFSTSDERTAVLRDWAEIVRRKPSGSKSSHGEGYFYSLAMAQPLVDNADSDFVCQAILERWDAEYEIDMKVAILRSLTRSHLLREKPTVFLDILATGLNDYTTTARGDVGSHVRVQALKAVHSLWQNIKSGDSNEWVVASVKALFYNTLRLSAEKLDRIRPNAQVAISVLLKER
jgi:tubulin-specific chaperone D